VFHHHPAGPNLQRLKQPAEIKPFGDLTVFTVDSNLHLKKNRIRKGHPKGDQGIRFQAYPGE
jgi:hypothetical protein